MNQALLQFHFLAFLTTVFFLFLLNRIKDHRGIFRGVLLLIIFAGMLLIAALLYQVPGFARIQLAAWVVFAYFPIYLIGSALLLGAYSKRFVITSAILLGLILLIAIDAFLIEPQWLDTTQITLNSERIQESIRVAVLSDIQTDRPGPYEKKVLAEVKRQQPDLILMTGDYIQLHDREEYIQAIGELNQIFQRSDLTPGMGIYAIRGNVDWNGWESIFNDLDVVAIQQTESLDLGPIVLTGIGLLDSENIALSVDGNEKYHIVMGHSPNFSLGDIEGDLLLAGHTHGGQVQIPGIGPILTLSAIPRKWASGLTEIHPNQYLYVSRGIGLERGYAPRMRFFCRPELLIIDLQPVEN